MNQEGHVQPGLKTIV